MNNSRSAADCDATTIECHWAVLVRPSFFAKETSGGRSELPAKPRGDEGKQSSPDVKKTVLAGAKTFTCESQDVPAVLFNFTLLCQPDPPNCKLAWQQRGLNTLGLGHRPPTMTTAIVNAVQSFPGLCGLLVPSAVDSPEMDDITEDFTAEQETILVEPGESNMNGISTTSESRHAAGAGLIDTTLQSTLMEASKGVTEGTNAEYKRLMNSCVSFLRGLHLLGPSEDFFSKKPRRDTPWLIVAWIMNMCDSINLDGTPKLSHVERGTYGHAQKMRASMTYAFGRLNGLGNLTWHESDIGGGLMVGNPSISIEVSSYMCSLRRRKVQAGEAANSARAITSEILLKLYHYNHCPENWTIRAYQPGERVRGSSGNDPSRWGGGRVRRLLSAAYTVAFICMLRFDEVLKIQVHDLRVHDTQVALHLPFRKTHQNGDIKPFHLWPFSSSEAHLCPVRALAAWLKESKITTGYLFRKIASGDRITEANSPMSSEQFLELFRNNLLDVDIDPTPYGTHSFRRGGCQFLHVEKRWSLRRICEWGGWSVEFTNMTIVKYLISSNDDPTEPREQFLNPNRQPMVKCSQCGRCCSCG